MTAQSLAGDRQVRRPRRRPWWPRGACLTADCYDAEADWQTRRNSLHEMAAMLMRRSQQRPGEGENYEDRKKKQDTVASRPML